MPKAKEREPGFEESMASLETIVIQLESGDLPLERALELFQDGVGLARRCQSQLEEAERKVELLLRERGEIRAIPFDPSKTAQGGESENSAPATSAQAGQAVRQAGPENDPDKEDDVLDESIPF